MNAIVKRCHYCENRMDPAQQTRDHIVPRSIGGPDRPWNIVICCKPCNQAKADAWPKCRCGKCSVARSKFREIRKRYAV